MTRMTDTRGYTAGAGVFVADVGRGHTTHRHTHNYTEKEREGEGERYKL